MQYGDYPSHTGKQLDIRSKIQAQRPSGQAFHHKAEKKDDRYALASGTKKTEINNHRGEQIIKVVEQAKTGENGGL